MMDDHVAHVKARFAAPVYISADGDVLADIGGKALIASAREIRMNAAADDMRALWSARYGRMRHDAADLLSSKDWRLA